MPICEGLTNIIGKVFDCDATVASKNQDHVLLRCFTLKYRGGHQCFG
jgi:hypothetical protein